MSSFSRSDVYAKSESGGEVMDELFNLLKNTTASPSIQELLNAINNKRTESVSDVVARYRQETGLDLVLSDNEATVKVVESEDKSEVKVASKRFLSKRQAQLKVASILDNPEVIKDIESYCSCSGGHKSLHSIIHALREKLGREDISYTDPDLVKFIEECKAKHQDNCAQPQTFEVGQIGTQNDNQDQIAECFRNSR